LSTINAYQLQISNNVQALTINRETEKDAFNTLVFDELDPAISAVQGAYPIIDSFSHNSASFVEVTRHMSKTFKQLVKAGKGAEMAGALTAMVSLSQNFSDEDLNEVRRLFEKLEASLVDAKNDAIRIENERETVYEATVAEYATIQDRLATTAAQLTSYATDMSNCVAEE